MKILKKLSAFISMTVMITCVSGSVLTASAGNREYSQAGERESVVIPVSCADSSSEKYKAVVSESEMPVVTSITAEYRGCEGIVTSSPNVSETVKTTVTPSAVSGDVKTTAVLSVRNSDVTAVNPDVTAAEHDVTTVNTRVTTQPVTMIAGIYETEIDGVVKKDVSCDWSYIPYGWTGSGDLTLTNEIGWFREENMGEFVDLRYFSGFEPIDKENYTVVQDGNESITVTFKEDYLKTLPVGKHFFNLEFEKTILSSGMVFAVAGKGDINADSEVNIYDVIKIAEYIIGKVRFSEQETGFADINNDGKVDLYDAIALSEYILKPDSTLPY